MSASFPNRVLVGYLRVLPPTADQAAIERAKAELVAEAVVRLKLGGMELIGKPTAMVVRGTAIEIEDPQTKEEIGLGEAIGIFIEVHVRTITGYVTPFPSRPPV